MGCGASIFLLFLTMYMPKRYQGIKVVLCRNGIRSISPRMSMYLNIITLVTTLWLPNHRCEQLSWSILHNRTRTNIYNAAFWRNTSYKTGAKLMQSSNRTLSPQATNTIHPFFDEYIAGANTDQLNLNLNTFFYSIAICFRRIYDGKERVGGMLWRPRGASGGSTCCYL
jgi:hypothetical protein